MKDLEICKNSRVRNLPVLRSLLHFKSGQFLSCKKVGLLTVSLIDLKAVHGLNVFIFKFFLGWFFRRKIKC